MMQDSDIEKKIATGAAIYRVTTILVTTAVTFLLLLVAVKFLWSWLLPDLFPGLVAQGYIAAELSWLAALKLSALVGALGAAARLLVSGRLWVAGRRS